MGINLGSMFMWMEAWFLNCKERFALIK